MHTKPRKRAPTPGLPRQRNPRPHRRDDPEERPSPLGLESEEPVYAFTPRTTQALSRAELRRAGVSPRGRLAPGPWDDGFRAVDFLARNRVFRFEEFLAACVAAGRAPATATSLLRHHVAQGRLERLRRGLYGPPRDTDPWVLGSKLTSDAVIAYDGALSFHGFTGLGHGLTVMTRERLRYFVYNEVVYRGVLPPPTDVTSPEQTPSIAEAEREGQRVAVTTRERTLVDTLDRLELGPGPEALWSFYRLARGVDYAAMAEHALRLSRQVTVARVGFFLEHLLGARHPLVERLRRDRPRSPIYFDRPNRRGAHTYDVGWNLNVPVKLVAAVRGAKP